MNESRTLTTCRRRISNKLATALRWTLPLGCVLACLAQPGWSQIGGPVDPAPVWQVGNGGYPVDAGEPCDQSVPNNHVATFVNGNGDFVYLFGGRNYGTSMGRYSTTKQWDLWTADGWSILSDAVPAPAGHAPGWYGPMSVYAHPDYADGLLGVTYREIRGGNAVLNVHTHAAGFIFDGSDFRQWDGGDDYPLQSYDPLIRSWNWDSGSFDYDPATNTGILVGTIGKSILHAPNTFNDHLTATRFDPNDPVSHWHRWHRPSTADTGGPAWGEAGFAWTDPGTWYADNVWPSSSSPNSCRKTFLMDPDGSLTVRQSDPCITHMTGTSKYLVTWGSSSLYALLCEDDGTPTWKSWNGYQWRDDYPFNPASVGTATDDRQQVAWQTGVVAIFYRRPEGVLREIIYNDSTPGFTASTLAATLPDDLNAGGFCVTVDASQTMWLFFTRPNGRRIAMCTRAPGEAWSDPRNIYTTDEPVRPVAAQCTPTGGPVVLFLKGDESPRLYSLAQATAYWSGQTTRNPDEPPPVQSLGAEVEFVRAVRIGDSDYSYSYGMCAGGAVTPASAGIDEDGYVYAPAFGHCNVTAFPPGGETDDNHTWGYFWDHVGHPGGAAVSNVHGKVYVANQLVAEDGGGTSWSGRLAIFDTAMRDTNAGYSEYMWDLPEDVDREYAPQVPRQYFGWPADVAVDECPELGWGRLYVTNTMANRVDVFDISATGLVHDRYAFSQTGLFESSIGSSHLVYVQQMVQLLINAGYLLEDASSLWWNSDDLPTIIAFLKASAPYADLDSGYDAEDFIRNVMSHHKRQHFVPDFLYSFGSYGDGAGQMSFPQGIDVDAAGNVYVVDSENNRVQRWVLNGATGQVEYDSAWGTPGTGAGEFIMPWGIAIDDLHGRIYVTDPINLRVQAFEMDGTYVHQWGTFYDENAELQSLCTSQGIAVDDYGNIYLGLGTHLATFRYADEAPNLTVTAPTACAVLLPGMQTLTGTVSDDWGMDRIDLTVTTEAGDPIVSKSFPVTDGPFSLSWKLPTGYPTGNVARVRVTAVDVAAGSTSVLMRVYIDTPGSAVDTDGDGLADGCDNCPAHYNPDQADCDQDYLGDVCVIADELDTDCNANGIPDACDLEHHTSWDRNHNDIPDECEPDCNDNDYPDAMDIASGFSADCNGNDIPDECDLEDPAFDCQADGIVDLCQLGDVSVFITHEWLENTAAMTYDLNGDLIIACDGQLVRVDVDSGTGEVTLTPTIVHPWIQAIRELAQEPATGDFIASSANGWFLRITAGGTVTMVVDPLLASPTGMILDSGTGEFLVSRYASNPQAAILRLAFPGGVTTVTPEFAAPELTLATCLLTDDYRDYLAVGHVGSPSSIMGMEHTEFGDLFWTIVSGPPFVNPIALAQSLLTHNYAVLDNVSMFGKALLRVDPDTQQVAPLVVDGVFESPSAVVYDASLDAYLVLDGASGTLYRVASLDCNMNLIPDECDITSGYSLDLDDNGIPDECE